MKRGTSIDGHLLPIERAENAGSVEGGVNKHRGGAEEHDGRNGDCGFIWFCVEYWFGS